MDAEMEAYLQRVRERRESLTQMVLDGITHGIKTFEGPDNLFVAVSGVLWMQININDLKRAVADVSREYGVTGRWVSYSTASTGPLYQYQWDRPGVSRERGEDIWPSALSGTIGPATSR